ncbi:hypothetical protein TPAU25S_00866 [Tsukamurella paurometabola]
MLARNAEALYWIGRYSERADDTARMLDVTAHQFLEDATVDEDRVSRQLVRVLGIPEPPADQPLDLRSVTEVVAYNRDPGSGSIAATIYAARENARGAREVTSSEMWECLNSTYNGLAERERAARRLGPHEFLNYIKNRAAMFSGLTDSTLSRDEGYRFLLLGRSIERMDMAIRLLLSRAGDRASSPTWVTVLRATGAHDTYLRTYRGVLDASRVVEFILVDRLFPRSVIHALTTAEDCLSAIEGGREGRLGTRTEAQRLLGRARGELESSLPVNYSMTCSGASSLCRNWDMRPVRRSPPAIST